MQLATVYANDLTRRRGGRAGHSDRCRSLPLHARLAPASMPDHLVGSWHGARPYAYSEQRGVTHHAEPVCPRARRPGGARRSAVRLRPAARAHEQPASRAGIVTHAAAAAKRASTGCGWSTTDGMSIVRCGCHGRLPDGGGRLAASDRWHTTDVAAHSNRCALNWRHHPTDAGRRAATHTSAPLTHCSTTPAAQNSTQRN